MEIKIYETKQAVAENFSKYLEDFIGARREVHIALSGGSTPKVVFDELASRNLSVEVWQKVHLYWGDERCVPPEDDDSNYKMTVKHLLSKINLPSQNVHRIKGENDPDYEAERYLEVLSNELPIRGGVPRFDLVILGMGDDGHTASIFPHQIELWHSENFCEVAVHPESGQKRITITGSLINYAATVAFLVTGTGKAEKVAEIINKEGDFKSYPASLVAPESGNLLWFLDDAAAISTTADRF